MIRRVSKAAKGLAKGQIANDVKSRVVEPLDHVDTSSAASALLVELLDEHVDVLLDDGLLVKHGLSRKAVGKGSPVSRMTCPVRTKNSFTHGANMSWVFAVLAHACLAVTTDLFSCVGVTECYNTGRHSHNRAVILVVLQHHLVSVAGQVHDNVGDSCRGPELWPGDLAQGVEVNIVYRSQEEIRESLKWQSCG